jgi:hypothetical protein
MLGPNCWEPKGAANINRDAVVYAARRYGSYLKKAE